MSADSAGQIIHFISSRDDFEQLRSAANRLSWLNGSIGVHVPGIPLEDNKRLESRLNKLAFACGCTESSRAWIVATIVVVAWWIWQGVAFSFLSVLLAVASAFASMVLVKPLLVLIARIQLHRELGALLEDQHSIVQ